MPCSTKPIFFPADTTRLETVYQIALLDQLSPTFISNENKLVEEAIAQKNILFPSAAIYAHIIYYYNLLDQKHAEQWLKRLEQLSDCLLYTSGIKPWNHTRMR